MPCYTWPKHTWIGIFIFLYGGDCQMHQQNCSMFSSSLRFIHVEGCRTFCGLKWISSVTLWSGATTPDATPELTRGLLRLSFNVPIMTRATVKINRIKATNYLRPASPKGPSSTSTHSVRSYTTAGPRIVRETRIAPQHHCNAFILGSPFAFEIPWSKLRINPGGGNRNSQV